MLKMDWQIKYRIWLAIRILVESIRFDEKENERGRRREMREELGWVNFSTYDFFPSSKHREREVTLAKCTNII